MRRGQKVLTRVPVEDLQEGLQGLVENPAQHAEPRDRAAEGGHVVLTFSGDMISLSALSGTDNGAHIIDLANAIRAREFGMAMLGSLG